MGPSAVSLGSSAPPTTAFSPEEIKSAYGIDLISRNGIVQDGAGQTIVIIDAYDNPKFVSRNSNPDVSQDSAYLASDLHKFCLQYGLPETPGFFTKVDQNGGQNYPSGDTGWGTEIALDVEWVHAIAPGAKIILVEASSNYDSNLLNGAAVWARDHSGASVVSMSFGGSESSGDSALNAIFQSPADHGITWLASTGDDGAPGGYPAYSPNVVAVGGTTLNAPDGVYSSETVWSGSGGGISSYESQPSYQQGLIVHSGSSVISQNGKRVAPDISFDADPATGVAVYDSYGQGSATPWIQVGGTSFSAPACAALVGIANQIRAGSGLPSLDGVSGTLADLYSIYNSPEYAADFHDITVGSNGYSAAVGYDLGTGIGTPMANTLVFDLAGVGVVPAVASTTPSLTGGTLSTGTTVLSIAFNRAMVGADVAANYQLKSVGFDGLLGTADDSMILFTVSYSGMNATLAFAALPENVYRLTLCDAITDFDGNKLDGDGDGTPGGDWVDDFVVVRPSSSGLAPVTTYSSGGSTPAGVAIGDFNRDGKPDLAVTNYTSPGSVGILLGKGDGSFGTATIFSSGAYYPTGITTGDFNNDGKLDLALADYGYGVVGILLGDGAGGFSAATLIGCGGSCNNIAAGDFNGDGKSDLVVANRSSNRIAVILGNGNGTFGTATIFSTGGSEPLGLTLGDFNGDGRLDLAVTNCRSNTVGVLCGDGNGGFGTATVYSSGGNYPISVAAGDFNGDGKSDLAVTNYYSNTVSVLLGSGSGSFGAATTFSSGGAYPSSVAVGDYNRDARLDLFLVNVTSNTVAVLLGAGNGTFSNATVFSSGGTSGHLTQSLALGDLNNDNWLDIAVANYDSNSVGVFMNVGSSCSVTLKSPNGLPFDIALGNFGAGELVQGSNDVFDGDGRLMIDGALFQPNSVAYDIVDNNQTVVTGTGTYAGLTVRREITVPHTGGQDFARTVDVFCNATDATITTTVTIVGNLGSDAATTVFATSDGDMIPESGDLWIGTDDATDNGAVPAVIHCIHGPSALQPASVRLVGDNIEWTYDLTVAAGKTIGLGYFTIVATNRNEAVAAANALVTPTGFGGQAAAFLTTDELQSLVNFVSTNHAPVLTAASPLVGATDEDRSITVGLSGTFINNGQASTLITDVDEGDFVGGIAVVGTAGRGTWYYSLDGETFTAIGIVSTSSTLLLPGGAKLRYTPDMLNGETPTITYRAWDQTCGTPGTKVNTTVSGGTTPFSAATDTASLTVADVNDAPVLLTVRPSLGATTIGESATIKLSDGIVNHGMGTTTITDVDRGASVGGIALAATTGYGVWSYSLDGSHFNSVGLVSAAAALLLPGTSQLRYTPDGIHGETATIGYYAWDTTSGTPETKIDMTNYAGGTTAISLDWDIASLLVNDAPVLIAASPLLGTTSENTAITIDLSGTFINAGVGTTTITDVNSGAVVGGIALVGTTGRGVWSYSLDGTTFSTVGSVNSSLALLLPSTAKLRYVPDLINGETPTITYCAWDQTSGTPGTKADTSVRGGTKPFSTATDTASLTVADVNDAPVLSTTSPSLGATTVGESVTIKLLDGIVNHGTGTTTITDADNGAIVGGIALAATTGYGVWSYSLDGSNFNSVGVVSAAAALLLPGTAQLRYTPDGIHGETATIRYYAWDRTSGTPEAKIDTTSYTGGTTAISLDADVASLFVNDAPVLIATSPSMGTTNENTTITVNLSGNFINAGVGSTTITDVNSGATVGGIALIGTTGRGVWSYSLDGTTFNAVGSVSRSSAWLLPRTAKLRYVPDLKNGETPTITYCAWDQTSGTPGTKVDATVGGGTTPFSTATDTALLTVVDVNDAPVLTSASPSLGVTNQSTITINVAGAFINHGTKTTTITDVDNGANLGGIAIVGVSSRNGWLYSARRHSLQSDRHS